MGNHQFAVNDFNQAIKLDANFSEAYYRRGVSKLKSRRFHEAIEDFKMSLELDTNQENPGVYDG
jgi:lipoprotein NlpI